MVKLSVAMPSYNHGNFIGKAIESVLTQEGCDLELIIVDDCSSDHSIEEIRAFKDPRLKLHLSEKNQGACLTLRKAIELGTGDYVAILNSDDCFLPGKLKKQIEFLDQNPSIHALFGLPQFIDSKGQCMDEQKNNFCKEAFQQPNKSRHEWLRHFFYHGNALCHPTVLIRRSCYQQLGYYNPCFAQLPDFDFWIRVVLHYNIHILKEELIQFRILDNGGNASAAKIEHYWQNQWEMTQILRRFYSIPSLEDYCQVFPEDKTVYGSLPESESSFIIPYAIAMKALNGALIHPIHQPAYQSFALQTLFDLLQNPDSSQCLQKRFDFSPAAFNRLSKQYEIFNAKEKWDLAFPERFPPAKKAFFQFKQNIKKLLLKVGIKR